MNANITLTPLVVLANRTAGNYGIGEQVDISCTLSPASATIAAQGGVGYRIKEGRGTLSAAATAAGTARFTASGTAGAVRIAAFGVTTPDKELAVVTLNIIAPNGIEFTKVGNVFHTHGQADAGFRGTVKLLPPGVSYQALQVREGEFKGKGSGYYATQNNLVHPASPAPVGVINGNAFNGVDTIYSGHNGAPWSIGAFEWYIPWQYRLGAGEWVTFAYATHKQSINANGRVDIAKHNTGPFSASPNDPDQAY